MKNTIKYIGILFFAFSVANVATQTGWLLYVWVTLSILWAVWTTYLFVSSKKELTSKLSFADLYAMHLYADAEQRRLEKLVRDENPFAPSGLEYYTLVDGFCQLKMEDIISESFPKLASERQKASDAVWGDRK